MLQLKSGIVTQFITTALAFKIHLMALVSAQFERSLRFDESCISKNPVFPMKSQTTLSTIRKLSHLRARTNR